MKIYKYYYKDTVSYYFTNNNEQYIYFYFIDNKYSIKPRYSTHLPSSAIEINLYELVFKEKNLIDLFFFNDELKEETLNIHVYFIFKTIKEKLEDIKM